MPRVQEQREQSVPPITRGQRWLRGLGGVLLTLGLLCNPWLLGALFSPDGALDDVADLAIIHLFQAVTIAWGVGNLLLYRRPLAAKLNLLAGSLLLVSPLLAELGFRLAIAARMPSFIDPGLYADSLCDDDYWKLRWLWSPSHERPEMVVRMEPNEITGWSPRRGPDNPLGLADQPVDASAVEQSGAVLFYGDSFVQGTTSDPLLRIPQQLDRLMDERSVFNLGVGGYGVDQIFLRLQQTHSQWRDPIVLLGILSSDLDRSVLRFRGSVKPYYIVRDGELILQGPPLPADNDQWLRENPPQLKSYLLAFVKMRWRLHQPGELREHPSGRREKVEINRRILQAMVEYCRRARLRFAFVLFFDPDELETQGWRETFLLEEMRRLNAPCANTKTWLMEAASQKQLSIPDLHENDHHLNAQGNRIVAEKLVELLRVEFF